MKKSEYGDLLAFSNIDANAVDTLFKIYIDTRLVSLAKAYIPQGSAEYWKRVNQFRLYTFDPYTAKTSLSDAQFADDRNKASDRDHAAQQQFKLARAFLYWFDTRASYWHENPPSDGLLQIMDADLPLSKIGAEAKNLQRHLEAAGAFQDPQWRDRRIVLLEIIAQNERALQVAAEAAKEAEAPKARAANAPLPPGKPAQS